MVRSGEKTKKRNQLPTKRTAKIIAFIREFKGYYGFSPSYREIKKECGFTAMSVVKYNIDWLIKNGYLVSGGGGKARSLTPTRDLVVADVVANRVKWWKFATTHRGKRGGKLKGVVAK